MSSWTSDLRFALRKLARAPLFTVIAVLTLAIGIGANTAVFSVVYGILLQPLSYPEPERLVGVWHTAPGLNFETLNQSPALHFTYREETEVFEDIGMWDNTQVSVTGQATPEKIEAMRVTDGTLPILGARPLHGRLFTLEDDSPDTAETVILSHGYWASRFASDPAAIGRTLTIDGKPREIIGVLRPEFQFLDYDPFLYVPFRFDVAEVSFGNFSYQGLGRLKPGRTVEQANAEIARLIPITLDRFPMPEGFTAEMVEQAGLGPKIRPLKVDVVGDIGKILWVLLGTVAVVLLVACANVANLSLVRAESRQQELATRSALGAGPGWVTRELMLESLILSVGGGIAGLGLSWAALRLLVALEPRGLPRLDEIGMNLPVLAFTLAISVLAAVAFGLFPILKLQAMNLALALKDGGRGSGTGRERRRARNLLVISQIAAALVLLIGSGLIIRSFQALQNVPPGFVDPEEVLTVRLTYPEAEVETLDEVALLHEILYRRLSEIPGVESVGLSTSITMDGWDSNDPVFVEEFPPPEDQLPPIRRMKWVSPTYFETMGNPILAGRTITWTEIHERAPVAVVTENFARQYWPDPAAAIGKRIKESPGADWTTIVGVVGNVHDDGVEEAATPVIYWPLAVADRFGDELWVPRWMAFALRGDRVGTTGFLEEVQRTIWAQNSNLPLANVRTLDEILDRSMARTSFTLVMLGIAALTALLLGAIGIYGVTSYVVSQRSQEMGVRMALGARRADVSRLVLRHGVVLATVGVGIGLIASAALTRVLSALLFGVSAVDPTTYGLAGLGVILTALLASYLPARRAASVDPIETLRWQ